MAIYKTQTLFRDTDNQIHNILYPSHTTIVRGLLDGSNKIDKALLPTASTSAAGIVQLTDSLTGSSSTLAASQNAIKTIWDKTQMLSGPIKYLMSLDLPTNIITYKAAQDYFKSYIIGEQALSYKANDAILVWSANELDGAPSVSYNLKGFWLWVYEVPGGVTPADYDSKYWTPVIDYPDIQAANWNGASQTAMVEGMITKEMMWKLKNTFSVPMGGTGLNSIPIGTLLVGNNTNNMTQIAAVAAGHVLRSTGINTNPHWGKIQLSIDAATGSGYQLPISAGGTGQYTIAANQVLVGSGAGTAAYRTVLSSITGTTTNIPNEAAIASALSGKLDTHEMFNKFRNLYHAGDPDAPKDEGVISVHFAGGAATFKQNYALGKILPADTDVLSLLSLGQYCILLDGTVS